jgi:hypothetical protein
LALSVRNGVLVYQQLICPMTDYAFPIRRSAASSHIRYLQVLQTKCLHPVIGTPWYVGNEQIQKDFWDSILRRPHHGTD